MSTRRIASLTAVFGALLFAAACGDTGLVTVPGEDKPGHEGSGYKLVITSPVPLAMQALGTKAAAVKLTKNGVAVPEAAVAFATLGTTGGSRLSALRATTDVNGAATIEVIAGADAAQFSIEIETEFTNPISYSVAVTKPDVAPASVRVEVSYPDQAVQPVRFVEIGLYASTVACDAVKLANLPVPLVPVQNLTNLANAVVFPGLYDLTQVTVLARGFNDTAPAAYGCATGVAITAGQETRVTVNLTKRELDLLGVYDYTTVFDMGDAIPGTVGAVIGVMADLFDDPDDPGLYLVEVLESWAADQGYVSDFGFFKGAAVDLVNSLIGKLIPDKYLKVLDWMGDAARVVKALTFEGTLTLAADANGNMTATEKWISVVYGWQGACDPAANPGCNRRVIALRNTHIREQTFTYPVTKDGLVLRIPAHVRTIPYARFFHLFLLQVVYPELVPGAVNTTDVLQSLIDCTGLGARIAASDDDDDMDPTCYTIAGTCLSATNMAGWCESGLGAAGVLADSKLDDLATDLPSNVNLAGAGEIKDADRDLTVEAFDNGAWSGDITVDAASYPVSGTFSATRQ